MCMVGDQLAGAATIIGAIFITVQGFATGRSRIRSGCLHVELTEK